jgi:hypothetical protein
VKFAKIVYTIAGIYGLLVLAPMYFTLGMMGRQMPPAITHPEFYYGFAGLAMVWQIAFLTIATDPGRFRPLMIVSVFEKAAWFITVGVLYLQGRTSARMLPVSIGDGILGVFFLAAFLKTRPAHGEKR